MAKLHDLQAAIGDMVVARQKAVIRKRGAGDPRNPFRALPGREDEFYSAAQSVRSYDLILKLLEKEARREATFQMKRVKTKVARVFDRIVGFYVVVGVVALATLGFGAAFILLQFPEPVVQAATVIGVALALARAVARK